MLKAVFMISMILLLLIPAAHSQTGWLSGWNYRRSHIFSQNAGASANFQMNITVHYGAGSSTGGDVYLNGHSQPDFDDVRITDDSGSTLLNITRKHYSYGDQADIWILLEDDLSSSNIQIWIYYGNTDADSVWDDAGVFIDSIDDVVLGMPMDEGTGTDVFDYSGFDNDGYFVQTPGWGTGRYGGGVAISRADRDYVAVYDADSLSFTDDGFTWLVWGYCNKTFWGASDEWATFWSKNAFYYEYWSTVLYVVDTPAPHVRLADMDFQQTGSLDFPVNQWNQFAVRWNGTYVDYFVNGTAGTSTAWSTGFSGSTQTEPLNIGINYNDSYSWDGILDEVMMINGTLTNAQIQNLCTYYGDMTLEDGSIHIRKWLDPMPSHGLTSGEEIIQTQGSNLMAALVVAVIILIPVFLGVMILLRRR